MNISMKAGWRGLLFATALTGSAMANAQDRTVEIRLVELNLDYEVDDDGDYAIVFNYTDEDRTQLVFVLTATQQINNVTIREVIAPTARVKENGIDGDVALMLLKNAAGNKIGSWEIRGEVLYFVAKVAEPVNSADLGTVLEAVAATADDMEIVLTNNGDEM